MDDGLEALLPEPLEVLLLPGLAAGGLLDVNVAVIDHVHRGLDDGPEVPQDAAGFLTLLAQSFTLFLSPLVEILQTGACTARAGTHQAAWSPGMDDMQYTLDTGPCREVVLVKGTAPDDGAAQALDGLAQGAALWGA